VEALGGAVEDALVELKYKLRARELMREIEAYDPIKVVVENIENVFEGEGI
jgi:hypothetical protein